MLSAVWNSDDSPGPADLRDDDVCPFCDGEVCTDEVACEDAAREHWTDQEIMYMRGK